MMDVSILGDIIRWPFEIIGVIIRFLIEYFILILIVVSSIYFIYWMFSRGIVKKISDRIILIKKRDVEDES